MTRRILGKTPSGTATKFGGEDTDYINQLLTGTDQSATDPVDMNTVFKFRSARLRLMEQSGVIGTDQYFQINGSSLTGNTTVSLPLLAADDTFAFDASTQTLTSKTIPGGSAATEGSNNYIADLFLYPSHRKFGGWIGGSHTNATGFAQGATTTAGTQTHSTSTAGKFVNWATTTAQNAQAGYRITANGAVTRAGNPTFAIKFRLNNTTNVRAIVGTTQSSNLPTAGSDDPIGTNNQTLALVKRSTDSTNWTLAHRGSAGTNFYDSTSIPIDTNPHIFRIKAVDADAGWYYSFDNGAYTGPLTSTDYPSGTIANQPIVMCEKTSDTSDTVTKSIDMFWIVYDSQEYP